MKHYEKIPLILSFVFNIIAIVIKYSIYLFTGSRAVLAEFLHSIGDTINSFTLYQGAVISARPSTLRYPFGRGRFAYLSSTIASVLLAGSVFYMIVVEGFLGVNRIEDPSRVIIWRNYTYLMSIPILMDLSTLLITIRIYSRTARGGKTLLKTLVLEDLMGISGNLIAITSLYISNASIDLYLSIIISLIIVASAIHIVHENTKVLVGVSAPREVLWNIIKNVISISEVVDINDIKSLTLEPGEYIIILQIEVSPDTSFEELMNLKNRITEVVKKIEPGVRYLLIDVVKPQEPSGSFVRIFREIRELKE